MLKLDKIIKEINKENPLILAHEKIPGSQTFFLLKKFEDVHYEENHLYGMKGIEFSIDDDSVEASYYFCCGEGLYLQPKNIQEVSSTIILGEEKVKQYLKETGFWETAKFDKRWDIRIGMIDDFIDNVWRDSVYNECDSD